MTKHLNDWERLDAFAELAIDLVSLPLHRFIHRCDESSFEDRQKIAAGLSDADLTQHLVYVRPLGLLKSEPVHLDRVTTSISSIDRSLAPRTRALRADLASITSDLREQTRWITDADANLVWGGTALELAEIYLYGRLLHADVLRLREWRQFDEPLRQYARGHAHEYVTNTGKIVCETLAVVQELKARQEEMS